MYLTAVSRMAGMGYIAPPPKRESPSAGAPGGSTQQPAPAPTLPDKAAGQTLYDDLSRGFAPQTLVDYMNLKDGILKQMGDGCPRVSMLSGTETPDQWGLFAQAYASLQQFEETAALSSRITASA